MQKGQGLSPPGLRLIALFGPPAVLVHEIYIGAKAPRQITSTCHFGPDVHSEHSRLLQQIVMPCHSQLGSRNQLSPSWASGVCARKHFRFRRSEPACKSRHAPCLHHGNFPCQFLTEREVAMTTWSVCYTVRLPDQNTITYDPSEAWHFGSALVYLESKPLLEIPVSIGGFFSSQLSGPSASQPKSLGQDSVGAASNRDHFIT